MEFPQRRRRKAQSQARSRGVPAWAAKQVQSWMWRCMLARDSSAFVRPSSSRPRPLHHFSALDSVPSPRLFLHHGRLRSTDGNQRRAHRQARCAPPRAPLGSGVPREHDGPARRVGRAEHSGVGNASGRPQGHARLPQGWLGARPHGRGRAHQDREHPRSRQGPLGLGTGKETRGGRKQEGGGARLAEPPAPVDDGGRGDAQEAVREGLQPQHQAERRGVPLEAVSRAQDRPRRVELGSRTADRSDQLGPGQAFRHGQRQHEDFRHGRGGDGLQAGDQALRRPDARQFRVPEGTVKADEEHLHVSQAQVPAEGRAGDLLAGHVGRLHRLPVRRRGLGFHDQGRRRQAFLLSPPGARGGIRPSDPGQGRIVHVRGHGHRGGVRRRQEGCPAQEHVFLDLLHHRGQLEEVHGPLGPELLGHQRHRRSGEQQRGSQARA